MKNCVFCKIVNREIATKIMYDSEDIMAFPDIAPIAPVHVLIIPKKHIASINDITDGDRDVIGRMIYVARDIATEKGIAADGYKLLFRTGHHGGQEVPHIHLHLIGGAQLRENIEPVKEMEK